MNHFYVYEHVRPDTGATFYVGKGKGKRAWCSHGRNPHWHNVVAKTGYVVRFAASNLDEELAFLVEIERISQLKLAGHGVVNLTSGGEGVSGYEPTAEVRAHRSQLMTGRKHSDETKAKISARNKGRTHPEHVKEKLRGDNHPMRRRADLRNAIMGQNNPMFGRSHTPEARKRISEANKGRLPSDETRRKRSDALSGEKNPMFGKRHSAESKKVIGSHHVGDKNPMRRKEVAALFSGDRNAMRNPEVASRLSAILKAKPRLTCPHCGKVGGHSQMKRSHFDKCGKPRPEAERVAISAGHKTKNATLYARIAEAIRNDPMQSNASIARLLNCSRATVSKVKRGEVV